MQKLIVGQIEETMTMHYRQIGNSSLMASAVGLGCFPFGGFVNIADSRSIVDQAIESGINYFDTANSYGLGKSEETLGLALQGRRERVLIATKFGNRMGDGIADFGTSRRAVIKACEDSLVRLKTDYIDLYQLHWPDRNTPLEETMRALDDLVRAGKIRYVGASNLFEWELCEAYFIAEKWGLAKFVSTQDHYNLLYRDIEKRFEPFCIRFGIGMTHYFPLAGGMLSGVHTRERLAPGSRQSANPNALAWHSERNWKVQEQLLAFAQERGWSLPQMSLAWLLTRPATFTVIAGADTPQQLQENVGSLDIRFTDEELLEIDRITLIDEDRTVAPVFRRMRPEKVHEFESMQRARAGAPSQAAH